MQGHSAEQILVRKARWFLTGRGSGGSPGIMSAARRYPLTFSKSTVCLFRVSGFGFQFRVRFSVFDFLLSGFGFGFRVSGFGVGFRASCQVPCVGTPSLSRSPPHAYFGFWVSGSGLRVEGFGLRVSSFELQASDSGFGFQVSDSGFSRAEVPPHFLKVHCMPVSDFEFRASGFGLRVSGFGFGACLLRVSGFGFRASGFGFRVSVKVSSPVRKYTPPFSKSTACLQTKCTICVLFQGPI